MPPRADLVPGTLDLLILKAVSLGPLHGRVQRVQRVHQTTHTTTPLSMCEAA